MNIGFTNERHVHIAVENFFFVEDMLQPTLLPYINSNPQTHLQQGNARPHIARQTKNFL